MKLRAEVISVGNLLRTGSRPDDLPESGCVGGQEDGRRSTTGTGTEVKASIQDGFLLPI